MTIKGKVLNSSTEERDLTGKDGTKRRAKINHVLLNVPTADGLEIVNIRAYDPEWTLPEVGKDWVTPRVKRYECFDGMIAEVSC